MKFSASILTLWAATASAAKIGSYEATNDVTVLTSMGTDLDAMGDALKLATDEGLATAQSLYETGSASTKTFKELSVSGNNPSVFVDYYGSETYGDEYIMAAIEGGTFAKSNFSGIDAIGKERKFIALLNFPPFFKCFIVDSDGLQVYKTLHCLFKTYLENSSLAFS